VGITTEAFSAIIEIMNRIEHRFLISADIERWLEKQECIVKKTEEFFVETRANNHSHYRRVYPKNYRKVTTDKDNSEVVLEISKEEYESELEHYVGKKVVKRSYMVEDQSEIFVVEKYLKKLKGIYILIASFDDERIMIESETLQALQPFVLKQIDRDNKYSLSHLALSVKPMEYNLDKMFEKIDEFEAANLFFWQVPSRVYIRDGVTLVLYKNLRLLHHYKMNFQNKHMSATLHRLRVLMRRTATILETFPTLFTPNVLRFCVNLLMRYHEHTKILRYLYFLEELCSTKEDAKFSLYSELKSLTSQEELEVTQMLLSQPFGQLIQILTRELYERELNQYKPLKKEVKKVVRERLSAFEELLQSTKEGYDEALLEKLYTSMDSLQTLIEDFFHIIGEKETQTIVEELNILLKPLREYRNCQERKAILMQIKEESANSMLDISPLLCEHTDELRDKIEKAVKLLRSSRFYI
jgi:CYTH domain-containing protein